MKLSFTDPFHAVLALVLRMRTTADPLLGVTRFTATPSVVFVPLSAVAMMMLPEVIELLNEAY